MGVNDDREDDAGATYVDPVPPHDHGGGLEHLRDQGPLEDGLSAVGVVERVSAIDFEGEVVKFLVKRREIRAQRVDADDDVPLAAPRGLAEDEGQAGHDRRAGLVQDVGPVRVLVVSGGRRELRELREVPISFETWATRGGFTITFM